ncbi:response regulator [Kitasatospora sp. NPDC048540]|uniref:response regulator n=1 Tax=unclassified Kitasatospora TaxID=2633591 RepID=UPI00068F5DCB|nr:response regulator [Kitasatospora sp. MBT63]
MRRVERERLIRLEAERVAEAVVHDLYNSTNQLKLMVDIAELSNRSSSFFKVLELAVERLCAYTGWPLGHVLVVDHDTGDARSSGIWGQAEADADFSAFRAAHEELRFGPRDGLPGRVLATGAPAWSTGETTGPTPGERAAAGPPGLGSSFAFPVLTKDRVDVVVQFFAAFTDPPSRALLELVSHVGIQIGWSIMRERDKEKLRAARLAAEESARSKSSFLATMSHEIRTPMNAVIGMTELLQGTRLTDEQRGFVEVIASSGELLLTIINDVLDYSKIAAGRLELELQPMGVQDCVESALDLVAPRGAEKSLELACLVDPGVPHAVVGDRSRLRQILSNLLSNAVKFTESGQVVVSVESAGPAPDGRYELLFSVADTGIGIPADRMDRLFREFSQVDASTTRRYGGTGLGLAISKRLAELMGGTMWVDSETDVGSTFHFTIQAVPAELPEARPVVQGSLIGRRVLVVDDNAVNLEVIRRHVTAWGMVAQVTDRPAEALGWISDGRPFDIAILDMMMPDTDGVTLAGLIRRQRTAKDLPLVLLSSLSYTKSGLAGADFAACLNKPVKASQLHNALVNSLASVEEGPEPGPPPVQDRPDGERSHRILLVEDNQVNQRLAVLMLKKLGYREPVLAENGIEALEALDRGRFDVVLMDVEMPEMDGLEATRRIHRAWADDVRPRIVGMTANAMAGDKELCLEAGMDGYIAKPIRLDTLAEELRQVRATAGGPAAGTDVPPRPEHGPAAPKPGKKEELRP